VDIDVEGIRATTVAEAVDEMVEQRLEEERFPASVGGPGAAGPSSSSSSSGRLTTGRQPSAATRARGSKVAAKGAVVLEKEVGHACSQQRGRARGRGRGGSRGRAISARSRSRGAPSGAQEAADRGQPREEEEQAEEQREKEVENQLLQQQPQQSAETTPIRTIDEVRNVVAEKAPTETSELTRQWERMKADSFPFMMANRNPNFYQFRNAAVEEPHMWWTRRLASKKGNLERLRSRMAGEIVLTVAVCDRNGRKEQEYDILASQCLYELRDAFHFVSDWMYDGPTRLTSACFFIDGMFYVDRRHDGALDYPSQIIDWLKDTREPGFLRADQSRSMDLRLLDLGRIPFGEKCVYIHQGDLEHAIYFTNARLLHSHDDCPFRAAYPVLTFMRKYNKRKCYACVQNHAVWVVIDSSRCPHNPSFWCQSCFRHFFQDEEGHCIPPIDYKVFPYLHDES